MILYNGTTGSLARYFAEAAAKTDSPVIALRSRLEDFDHFRSELEQLNGETAKLIHFAATVSVPWCEAHADEARKTTVADTFETSRIFIETCRKKKILPKILYVSSAHLYAKNDGTIHETDPVLPRSVYATTKLEAENALKALATATDTDLRIARVFGLVAPVQPDYYVLHSMLKRARERRTKEIPGLSNLRDYLDSRDVCRALLRTIELDSGTFLRVCPDRILNVASGTGNSIRFLAETCLRAVLPPAEAEKLIAELTEAPSRADDVPRIVGSVDRYRSLFGENPQLITLAETVRDAVAVSVSATTPR